MNGKENSNSAEQLLKIAEESLDAYEQSLGLKAAPSIVIDRYLHMQVEEMNRLQAEECDCAAIVLAQFAFYLQKAYNSEKGKANYASTMVDRIVMPKISNYKAPSAPERRQSAIKDDEAATKWEKLRNQAQSRVDRLDYLPAKIDALALRFAGLAQTKRMKQNVNEY